PPPPLHCGRSGVAASQTGVSVMGSRGLRPHTRRTFPNERTRPMTTFPALTHVALTVRDLSVSVPWYAALLDSEPVIDEDTDPDLHHTVFLLDGGTLLGLHQHGTKAPKDAYSEYRVGLDHVAFGVADRKALETWAGKLDELGIRHGGIK